MSELDASYDFLSWMRRGAVSEIDTEDTLSGPLPYRAALGVKLGVDSARDGAGAATDDVSLNIELYGPGDVLGIDPRHIIRGEPEDGALTFEPNYLAAIEFHHPDFPWLFSVAAPKKQDPAQPKPSGVRPWLALVVLADGEYTGPNNGEPLPSIEVADAKHLPNLGESWAWAHAQVSGGLGAGGAAALAEIARTEPKRLLSRIVCPRRLSADTHYTAFLVPAFEAGRLAGLGKTVPTTDTPPAWSTGDTNVELPVYHSFSFRTSAEGDFESLVARLEPRAMPPEVGRRPMRMTDVGWNVPDAGDPLGLPGALCAPDTADTPWPNPGRHDFQQALGELVNQASDSRADDPNDPDPVVVPPIYGRWHAARKSIDPAHAGWLNELNSDPRTRAVAGFGTRLVVDQVAQLLASAWLQVQGVIEANARLRQAQMAREAMSAVHEKHLRNADQADAVIFTGALHSKVTASPRTVRAVIVESRLPQRALSGAFRRITRPLGPLQRRLGAAAISPADLLRGLNSGALSPAPPYRPPAGLVSLERASPDRPCPGWVPRWLRPWLRLVAASLVVLAVVLVVVLALVGAWVVGAVLAAVLALLALGAWLLVPRCAPGAGGLNLTDISDPGVVTAAPPQPGFHLAGSPAPTGVPASSDSPEGARFRAAAERLAEALKPTRFEPPEREPVNLGDLRGALLEGLDPETTVAARTMSIVQVTEILGWQPPEDDPIEPIMAAPEFPQPMYEPLRDMSQDMLLPGLDAIPPDTVSLLSEERSFIEAYMVGLNHEMGRQLLWSGYPTDQRGSYFRQFWDVSAYIATPSDPTDPKELGEQLKDIPEIHRWSHSSHLGQHPNRPDIGAGTLILLVRGELLRRYPHADVYACPAVIDPNGDESLGEEERHPLYAGTLPPDITFFGFALGEDEARGTSGDPNDPGWFFVFQPQAWEPRFGLEPAPQTFPANPGTVTAWNDLAWTNFASDQTSLNALAFVPATAQPQRIAIQVVPNQNPGDDENDWGLDSAQTAFITLRRPVRVGIHARRMLP